MTEQKGIVDRRKLIVGIGALAAGAAIGVSVVAKNSSEGDDELVKPEQDEAGMIFLKEIVGVSFPKKIIDSLGIDKLTVKNMFGRQENLRFPGYPKGRDNTEMDGYAFTSEIVAGKKEIDDGNIYGFSCLLNTWNLEEGNLVLVRGERPSGMPLFVPEKGMVYSKLFPDAESLDVEEINDESSNTELYSQRNGVRIAGLRENGSKFVAEVKATGNMSITTFVPHLA